VSPLPTHAEELRTLQEHYEYEAEKLKAEVERLTDKLSIAVETSEAFEKSCFKYKAEVERLTADLKTAIRIKNIVINQARYYSEVIDKVDAENDRLRAQLAWIVKEFGAIDFSKNPSDIVKEIVFERYQAYLDDIVNRSRKALKGAAPPAAPLGYGRLTNPDVTPEDDEP